MAADRKRPGSDAMDQHGFIASVFEAAGGEPVDAVVPAGYTGKRADILFRTDGIIAEIKSLTSDRRNDPKVGEKLGEMLARDPAGPVIFGEVTIGLHDLPGHLAERALREVGDRVRKEVSSAGKQIEATRTILDMPEAYGLLVFVSPPDRIGHQSIAWLVNDIVRQSADRCKLDGLLVMETALGLGDPEGINANSFSSVWSISGRPLPEDFGNHLGKAWEQMTSQPARTAEVGTFTRLGSAE